jgi:hypothetical protein
MEPQANPRTDIAWRESYVHFRMGKKLLPGVRIVDGYWRLDDPVPGLVFYTAQRTIVSRRKNH